MINSRWLQKFKSVEKQKKILKHDLNPKNLQSLLFALFAVLIPHMFFMPVSLAAVVFTVLMLWQILLYKTGNFQKAQQKWLQYAVVLIGLGLIYLHFRTFLGVEAGCATLALILLGKAFEVKNYRDAVIELNFALFVVAALFLYGQSILIAVAAVIAIVACLYAMYQLQNFRQDFEEMSDQQVTSSQLTQQAFKIVIKLILLASPLMVLLFLFFPRFPPLWNIPLSNSQAKTGVTDEMSPGDIAQLSQSSELAFRVIFAQNQINQAPPISAEMYWRAMVLEDFDGIKWTQNPRTKYNFGVRQTSQNSQLPKWYTVDTNAQSIKQLPYQMIIEPTYQPWLYALDFSKATEPLMMKADGSIQSLQPISRRQNYQLTYLETTPKLDLEIQQIPQNINLRLPQAGNPKSQAFAQQLFKQNQQNPERYAHAVLSWIRTQQFSYTLSPPLLKDERIDDFLFRTKAGFCEHYASAYANLMRMAGIPARVVVGYQGGRAAPDGQSWEVRQLDAHAWTEVWFAGKGWVRIDPTAAIAPDRINLGMQNYAQQNDHVFGEQQNAWNMQQQRWATQAKIWVDYVNFQWQSKVVGFDQNSQQNWLKKLSIGNLTQQLILMIIAMAVLIALMVWWLSRQQKKQQSQLEIELSLLSKKLENNQLQRREHEPVLTWLNRIYNAQNLVDHRLIQIIELYTRHQYIQPLEQDDLKNLYQLLRKYTFKPTVE